MCKSQFRSTRGAHGAVLGVAEGCGGEACSGLCWQSRTRRTHKDGASATGGMRAASPETAPGLPHLLADALRAEVGSSCHVLRAVTAVRLSSMWVAV